MKGRNTNVGIELLRQLNVIKSVTTHVPKQNDKHCLFHGLPTQTEGLVGIELLNSEISKYSLEDEQRPWKTIFLTYCYKSPDFLRGGASIPHGNGRNSHSRIYHPKGLTFVVIIQIASLLAVLV